MRVKRGFRLTRWAAVSVVLGMGLIAFGGRMQDRTHVEPSQGADTAKHVTFAPAVEVAAPNGTGAPLVAEATADFDRDGHPDLVTADSSGGITLYKGGPLVPLTKGADDRSASSSASGTAERPSTTAFSSADKTAELGFAADHLFAGDFNADGRPDLIAVAIGRSSIVLLSGDGAGHFAPPTQLLVNGRITAIESGEIGRRDGQADLAIAFRNPRGSFVAVYEHPEGAFSHAPEMIKLPSIATAIAIGNTDGDFYSDVALACGRDLVVIHERGQAYPWDAAKSIGIVRPPAQVDVRRMDFAIADLTVGHFIQRGTDLALLSSEGMIYGLRHDNAVTLARALSTAKLLARPMNSAPFLPDGGEYRNLATIANQPMTAEDAENAGLHVGDRSEFSGEAARDLQLKHAAEQLEKLAKTDRQTLKRDGEARAAKVAAERVIARQGFLDSISAKASPLASSTIEPIAANGQLAAAGGFHGSRLRAVNVSDSEFDDLAISTPSNAQLQIVSRVAPRSGGTDLSAAEREIEVTAVEAGGSTIDVLPMRLNADSLSDLVVLSAGSTIPSVVMSAPTVTLLVTSSDDSGDCINSDPCSLRNAIQYANTHSGVESIQIDNSVTLITPSAELPAVTSGVNIFGNLSGDRPTVEISGANVPAPANGLSLRSSNSFVYGLIINRFKSVYSNGVHTAGSGIAIFSSSNHPDVANNTVLKTYLGTDATGNVDLGNDATGLNIFDSDNNAIVQNIISGNGSRQKGGDGIGVTGGNSNVFANNIVGLNAAGNAKLPNSEGVFLVGSDNRIGGDNGADGNTISGNGKPRPPSDPQPNGCDGSGMRIVAGINLDTGELLTLDNNVLGNKLGTDPTGHTGLGNCWQAIDTSPLTQTVIGSITQNGRNIISDNGLDALYCGDNFSSPTQGGFCAIVGNNIGTDVTGTVALPNTWANQRDGLIFESGIVQIYNSLTISNIGAPGGTTPGGSCTGFCNVISGNAGSNIAVLRGGPGTVGIFNNFIGPDSSGTMAVPSEQNGIELEATGPTYIGLDDPTPLGNVISGNNFSAIQVNGFANQSTANQVVIEGNLIGTDTTGMSAVPNALCTTCGYYGTVFDITHLGEQVSIGGPSAGQRNIISGNRDTGITVNDFGGSSKISNNYIGINKSFQPLGNRSSGIVAGYLPDIGTVIGGDSGQEGNIIAYNGTDTTSLAAGVLVDNAYNISIRNNRIFSNNGLGIDLGRDGVTANDECANDADTGSNMLQNYPDMSPVTVNPDGSQVISGTLKSHAREHYTIDIFANNNVDPTGYGEGEIFFGSVDALTDANGFAQFSIQTPPGFPSYKYTATATDSFGNTSEFSCATGQCSQPGNVTDIFGPAACVLPIVVNNDLDLPDANLNDGVCDDDVNTDGLQCSLRAAMQEAEHQPGANAITFDIPGAGPFVIAPQTPLPQMTQPVSIDASTQSGYAGTPLITVNGEATTGAYGFQIAGGNSLIRGLSVVNFKEQIGLSNSGNGLGENRITGNYIGIWPNGSSGTKATQQFGVALVGSTTNNRLGGTDPADRNIISGNGVGVSIVTSSNNNSVLGNYIGTDPTGVAPIPNDYGVSIQDSNSNRIGSLIDSGSNLISGNTNDGVEVLGTSKANKVVGDLIGTDVTGTLAIGNKRGVEIHGGATSNTIGGTTASERNIISGQDADNNSVGVLIGPDAGVNNVVSGNFVGISKEGAHQLTNRVGIAVNADTQTIGSSTATDFRNVILATDTTGGYCVYLHPFFPNDELNNVSVLNNDVGVSPLEAGASGEMGIFLNGDVKSALISGNTVGYARLAGIRLLDGPHNNTIQNNRVGIDTSDQTIPNFYGIVIKQSDTNFIKNNVVSGNISHGIVIGDGFGQNDLAGRPAKVPIRRPGAVNVATSSFATNNIVTGNKVGTDAAAANTVPNGDVGIGVAANARSNTIGGEGNLGNIVGGSTGDFGIGIFVGIIDDSQPSDVFPQDNKVLGNRVGLGPDGSGASLPNRYGIYVRNAVNTVVGGPSNADANVVGNNQADGIRLFKPGTVDSTVSHNYVGVTLSGDQAANGGDGISADGVTNILIEANTVAGNQGNGIHLANITVAQPQLRSARDRNGFLNLGPILKANLIGGVANSVSGAITPLGNALNGLFSESVSGLQLGTSDALAGGANIIIANALKGVLIDGGSDNTITSALVGTTPQGDQNAGNGDGGIRAISSIFLQINNSTVSGNQGDGISISDLPIQPARPSGSSRPTDGVIATLVGNIVGLSPFATNGSRTKIPNTGIGCLFTDVNNLSMKAINDVTRTLIGGNGGPGVVLRGDSTNNDISGTIIGTDENGTPNLGNQIGLVLEQGAHNNAIGDINTALRTVLQGNNFDGLKLDSTVQNMVKNCMVKLNGSNGITVTNGSAQNTIGGTEENAGNEISENGGAGVFLDPSAGQDNVIDPNTIFGNTGAGIDLGGDGATANDPADGDSGPNNLQNFPEFVSAVIGASGDLTIVYKVDSDPVNSDYTNGLRIEFFKADGSASLQGQTFIGSDQYGPDDYAGAGHRRTLVAGNAALLGIRSGDKLIATATDSSGNTSEFTSTNVGFVIGMTSAAHVPIAGRVTTASGSPVRNARIELRSDNGATRFVLTNAFGYYQLDQVEIGRMYVLTASGGGLTFEHATKLIHLVDAVSNEDFQAEP